MNMVPADSVYSKLFETARERAHAERAREVKAEKERDEYDLRKLVESLNSAWGIEIGHTFTFDDLAALPRLGVSVLIGDVAVSARHGAYGGGALVVIRPCPECGVNAARWSNGNQAVMSGCATLADLGRFMATGLADDPRCWMCNPPTPAVEDEAEAEPAQPSATDRLVDALADALIERGFVRG